MAIWGEITGDISDQSDLVSEFDQTVRLGSGGVPIRLYDVDANDIRGTGYFMVTNGTNMPTVTTASWYFWQIEFTSSYRVQYVERATLQGDTKTYKRRINHDEGWQDWIEIITSTGGQTINGELTVNGVAVASVINSKEDILDDSQKINEYILDEIPADLTPYNEGDILFIKKVT